MPKIKVIGLGAGDLDQMPLGVYRELKKANQLWLRTKEHPVIRDLEQEGVHYHSFDDMYVKHDQFESVYQEIVSSLIDQAQDNGEVYYAVPGHPMVAERTVQMLLKHAEKGTIDVEILGGQSFIDPLLTRLKADPVDGLLFVDGTSMTSSQLQPEIQTVITQVYDQMIASEVKLTLMEVYPDEHPVTIATAVGIPGEEKVVEVALYELDRVTTISNLTAVFVPRTSDEGSINRQYYRSREIFRQLRGPQGCPWDLKQTHQSLRKYLLEETNEVIEAIDEGDDDHLKEELGDVLLQVFLHAQIAEDEGFFNMEDVLESLNEKMIRRHPHVFGDAQVEDAQQVKEQWDEIKKQEKESKNSRT